MYIAFAFGTRKENAKYLKRDISSMIFGDYQNLFDNFEDSSFTELYNSHADVNKCLYLEADTFSLKIEQVCESSEKNRYFIGLTCDIENQNESGFDPASFFIGLNLISPENYKVVDVNIPCVAVAWKQIELNSSVTGVLKYMKNGFVDSGEWINDQRLSLESATCNYVNSLID